MSAMLLPHPQDARLKVRVGHARVSLADTTDPHHPPSALVWQQRVEDALRCAHLRDGQRLVLLKKLQVTTGSALAPGWAKTIEAAIQDAVSRARPARSLGAEQAAAVWFESWDDAVAAWLDVTLAWPVQAIRPQAWFLPRIANMAGLTTPETSPVLAKPFSSHLANAEQTSQAVQQAQAMWMRWKAKPGSQRACKNWLAKREVFRGLLQPTSTSSWSITPADLNVPDSSGRATPSDSAGPHDKFVPKASRQPDSVQVSRHASSEAASELSAATDNAMALPDAQALSPQVQTTPDALAKRVFDARLETSLDSTPPFTTSKTTQGIAETPSTSVFIPEPTSQAAPHLLGWTHLRHTHLGGLPLTITALQRMGFADQCDRLSHGLDQIDQIDQLGQCCLTSAPWLAVWSRMGALARQRWVRDPMFQVLPVFDALAHLPAHDWADTCLRLWHAQPTSTHQFGLQTWRALQTDLQKRGWRSPRVLLQRHAWMQLSDTHLDVIFSLDQVDLQVRRHGLDADLGWVPWLGRIVALHFEPADQLPPWSAP